MSRLNTSLTNEYQTTSLKEKIAQSINGVDLNWRGFSRNSKDTFVKYRTSANINRCLFWLGSKPGDFIRESDKGGILYNLISSNMNETNLTLWEQQITSKFNEEFGGDLFLMYVKLYRDSIDRTKLHVDMIVRDVIENTTFPVSTIAKN